VFLSLKGPVALEAASGTAREVLLLDQRGRPAFKGLRVFRLEPNVGTFMVVGRWPLDNLTWGASLVDTRHGEAFAVEWPRPYISPGIYPTAAEALLAAKCAAEWEGWKMALSDTERAQAESVRAWFGLWVGSQSTRPRPLDAVTAMRAARGWNAHIGLMEHLIKCRYDSPSRYPALGRALDAVGWPRGEPIPGERPLTPAEQRAHRAKKKPKKKPRAVAPRRPPQDPLPQARQFGYCKRCHVCLAYDAASGCCTVCSRPLTRLNPETLGSTQIRALLKYADKCFREGDVEEGKAALSRAYMFVTVAGKFKPSELERRRLDKLLVEIEEKWAAHQTPADNPRRGRRPKRQKRNPDGCYVQTDNFDLQLHLIQGRWDGLKPPRLQGGGVGHGAGVGFGNKPPGAFWTSTLGEHEGTTTSDWDAWVQENMPGWREGTAAILAVEPGARVLTLRTMKDYRAFAERYARPGRQGALGMLLTFDWPAVARDYDGVHVECAVAVGHDALYGWDAESTAWFNTDHLREVEVVKLSPPTRRGWMDPDDEDDDSPHENPGMRRFKDPGEATRHADRAARRSDQPHYVYMLSSNPRYAVLSEGHPVQYGIEQGGLDMGSTRLIHTAIPAPAPNPRRKRRKKKATSSRESRRARLRRLLRI